MKTCRFGYTLNSHKGSDLSGIQHMFDLTLTQFG